MPVLGSAASNPAVPPGYLNVKDYGALGDNSHDDTSAIQTAVNALKVMAPNSRGGCLYFPPGIYKVTSSLDFTGLKDCRILGTSGRSQAYDGTPGTIIYSYAGGAINAVDLRDCNGVVWDGVSIWNQAGGALTGVLMNWDATVAGLPGEHDVFGNRIQNCTLRALGGNGATLAAMDANIECTFDNVAFMESPSGTQVRMMNPAGAGTWSNANSFRSCSFIGSRSVSVRDPAYQTTFVDCTFEPGLGSGTLPAPIVANNLLVGVPDVVTFVGCGFWDVTGSSGNWFVSTVATHAWSFTGCFFESASAASIFNFSAMTGLALIGCEADSAGGGTPNLFTAGKNITNGAMIGCYVKSPLVDNHAAVFV